MRVVLYRPPAVGREELADSLAQALSVPRIHIGDLFRAHLSQGTELGIRAAEIINSGMLIPDEMIIEIVGAHLSRTASSGFLLDGYPRTPAQALALDNVLWELGTPLDGVLHLRLSTQERERRIHHRAALRLCRSDPAHRFHPEIDTALADGVCSECGGELYQRDHGDNVRRQFGEYEALLEPLTQHYARQRLLLELDAVGTPQEVTCRAVTALRARSH